MKLFIKETVAVLAVVGLLSACTKMGTLTPAAQTTVTQVLDTACPVLGALAGMKLSQNQNLAYNTLSIACPPNAPPTNAVTVALDLVTAYNVLSPLLAKK